MLSAREENVIEFAVVPVLDVFRVNEPLAAGAVLDHVVPLLVRIFQLVHGATTCNALVPLPRRTLFAVKVVAPVPQLATETGVAIDDF